MNRLEKKYWSVLYINVFSGSKLKVTRIENRHWHAILCIFGSKFKANRLENKDWSV